MRISGISPRKELIRKLAAKMKQAPMYRRVTYIFIKKTVVKSMEDDGYDK